MAVKPAARVLLFFFCVLVLLTSPCTAQVAPAPRFQCSGVAKCQALAGYVTDNETSYDAIKSLFQVKSIRALYGANDINASTPASARVPAGTTVRVPFPCACANGTGISDRRPVYTIKKGDILYDIANTIFKAFVTFQQIGDVNKLGNDSLIEVGQKLWIPLPCSCDAVDGHDAVHLAHMVAAGSTVGGIANQAGTTETTLLRINNISDPRTLKAGQILDVPLRACASAIRNESLDHSLRVPNGSYALTAGSCVKCSCSSSSWRLGCEMVQDPSLTKSSECRAPTCSAPSAPGGSLLLGGQLASGGCAPTRCEYAGYNSSAISASLVTDQTACTPPASAPTGPLPTPGSGAHALRAQLLLLPSLLLLALL